MNINKRTITKNNFIFIIIRMTDRVKKTLKITLYTVLLVALVLWLLSVSCMSGWCSTHNCSLSPYHKKSESFDENPLIEGFKMNVDHVGGYYQIGYTGCDCNCVGPRFSLSKGAGQYAFMKGQPRENGFYGPAGDNITPQDVDEYARRHKDNTKTPSCQAANCGLNDIPKCQCGKSQCLCCRYQSRRGCPQSYGCGKPHYYGQCGI